MMVKQGGTSMNQNGPSKRKGGRPTHRCSLCGRSYSMDWCKDRHERQCKEYRDARKSG